MDNDSKGPGLCGMGPFGYVENGGERRSMAEKVGRQAFSCIYQAMELLKAFEKCNTTEAARND